MQSMVDIIPKLRFDELGLGIEHFVRQNNEDYINQILWEAYNLGITHFDIVYNYPHFFNAFKGFLNDKKDEITFTSHIGQIYDEKTQKSKKSRSLNPI